MRRLLLGLVGCWLLVIAVPPACGQAEESLVRNKLSNDDPGRPLQMPPAASETRAAFEDFDRFARRGAWERALEALDSIPEDQRTRFIDGNQAFIVTVGQRRLDVLAGLPSDGQAAYRLFYDAEARKRFEILERQRVGRLEALEQFVARDFPSVFGDNAADRLGDLYFEQGRFDQAADRWLMVLRQRPDTDLDPALLALKAALALSRSGRVSELAELRAEINNRYRETPVSLGGQTGPVGQLLEQWIGPGLPTAEAPVETDSATFEPATPLQAEWRFRIADNITAGMSPVDQAQWNASSLSVVVPAVAADGAMVFANYLGHIFALDLETGKLVWRSAAFHHLGLAAMREQSRMIDPTRFAIAAGEGRVWSVTRDMANMGMMASYHLECRRADKGELLWRTSTFPDYNGLDLNSDPLLARGRLYVCATGIRQTPSASNPANAAASSSDMVNQGMPRQYVLAVNPVDGRLLWAADVGALRQSRSYYYYGYQTPEPRPVLLQRNGALYLETQQGLLARLDAVSGRIDWGFAYPAQMNESQNRFFFINGRVESNATPLDSRPVVAGDTLLVKASGSDELAAIAPDRRTSLWRRPIARSSRLLAARGNTLYLGGPEAQALDLDSRRLLWATPLPGGSLQGRLLIGPQSLWQLTPRGLFELDPADGHVRRILRGDDTGAAAGELVQAGRWLLALTNRSISAYSLGPPSPGQPAHEAPENSR